MLRMKMHFSKIIVLFFLFLFFQGKVSFAQEYHFKYLTSEDGLSSNIVQCINKDSRGYLWVGCNNALNRFDGSNFRKFAHNAGDSTSITSGPVLMIEEDQEGILWITTKNGVCTFDYKTEKFTKVFDAEHENSFIRSFFVSKMNEKFIIAEKDIYCKNQKTTKFERYFKTNVDYKASAMLEDQNGNFVIGTWGNGITISKSGGNNFKKIKISTKSAIADENSVQCLAIDKSGTIWIGTRFGLYKAKVIDKKDNLDLEISSVLDKNGKPIQLSNEAVHCLSIDDSGKIWIGTEDGLNIFDPEEKMLRVIRSKKNATDGLSNNLINCFYFAHEGGMWIGTHQGGINFYSQGNSSFKDKIPIVNQSENKRIQYVKSIFQDADQKLWIGTDYGLLRFSKDYKLEQTFTNNATKGSLSLGGVTTIFKDSYNDFWVGTWGGGINKLDKSTNKFTYYSKLYGDNTTDLTLSSNCNTKFITEDSKGYLWIISMFQYVDRFDRKTNLFRHCNLSELVGRPNMVINSVSIDRNDVLWIGATGAGLIKMDTKTFTAKLFTPSQNKNQQSAGYLPSIDVYSVNIQKSGTIWLGTGNGLSHFDPETEIFTNYSAEEGLNSETVLGVVSDINENIWLSTLKGISKFNTKTKYFTNYDAKDGVISNAEVAYKGANGMLYFAGVNGITIFHPDSIWKNQTIPPVVFSDFKLFDQSVLFDKKILPFHINEVNEVVLNYAQNNFRIEFSALNFIQSGKNTYSCKLEGFDKDWFFLGAKNEAKYTNLNPGTYYFKLRAANNSGVWNNKERVLKIVILPPWWKTWQFRISVVLLIVLLTGLFIRIRIIQLIHQKEALKLKVKERTLEIEKQQIELKNQANELQQANTILLANQQEIEFQKESITKKNSKLEEKNKLLEQQKEQILAQKIQTEILASELHEADLKKIRFMTNVSHEFRTPLTLIYSPLENTLREFETIEKNSLQDRLKMMYRNTKRLLKLINEFLDFSKIDAGLLKMSLSKGNLKDYIFSIVESYKYLSEQNGIHFIFRSNMENTICLFDADKIDKIVSNLLSNAFKYTALDGTISIELNAYHEIENQEIERIQIIVQDSGIGIAEKHQHKIFERFFQIDGSGEQTSGTGIGLALTHELVTIYGGQITVDSQPGKGSIFTVTLPCSEKHFNPGDINNDRISVPTKPETKDHPNLMTINESPGTELSDKGKPTLLLIEDSRDIIEFLQNQFSDDFNFVFATDGLSGFEMAVSIIPQAIILDIMMPKLDGYQVCEKLKKDQRTCHVPVIFLTALAERADQLKGLEFAADDYITKPFDVEILKAKVLNLIETRKKLKQVFQTKLSVDSFELVPDSTDEKLIKKILVVVEKEMGNPNFGVEELSYMIGLSRSHLFRKVRDITNQTPVELIRNLRLEKAAKLLKENKFYISEVAYMAGFTELTYFRRIFKDFYGVSPSDFAKGTPNPGDEPDLE